MRTWTQMLIAGCTVVLAACGAGVADGPLGSPDVQFQALVTSTPEKAEIGKRVTITIDITNLGQDGVEGTLELRIAGRKGVLYEQSWPQVAFGSKENWTLTQGFLTSTDADTEPYSIGLRVFDPTTGEEYFHAPQISTLTVQR